MSRASRWYLSLLFSCLALPVAWAGTVTVYTSLDEDEIPSYVAGAKKAMPDIDLKVLRLSTGDLAARIMAEAANPQNDVIWAWALTNMLDPRILALLEPYQPAAAKNLAPQFRAKDGKWFAITGYMEAFCVNTERLKAKGLPMPKDWEDLADPRFKGEVLMPSPVSSGTGSVPPRTSDTSWSTVLADEPDVPADGASGDASTGWRFDGTLEQTPAAPVTAEVETPGDEPAEPTAAEIGRAHV